MARSRISTERSEWIIEVLKEARAAYISILQGQVKSYSLGTRQYTALDLKDLKALIDDLEDELNGAALGRVRRVIPVHL